MTIEYGARPSPTVSRSVMRCPSANAVTPRVGAGVATLALADELDGKEVGAGEVGTTTWVGTLAGGGGTVGEGCTVEQAAIKKINASGKNFRFIKTPRLRSL